MLLTHYRLHSLMQKRMTLYALIIGKDAGKPLHFVDSIEAIAGKGLKGDRYFYAQGTFNKPQLSQTVREVSILPYESLAQCNAKLGTTLDFLDLRRNLIIKNFDAEALTGKEFSIGTAKFKLIRTCPPCRYLSRLLDADIMTGLKYIGGYRATIVQSGVICVRDEIEFK